MTDLNTTEAADDHAPDDTPLSRMLDPAAFTPKKEAPKTFTGDSHGLAEAADDLAARRKAEPKIKQRRLADDAPETLNVKDAARRLAFNRGADRALDRMERNPGENAWVSGNIVRQEMDDEAEPSVVEYAGKEKHERVTAREAARDLAAYRQHTAPAEEAAKAEQRRLLAELGALDLVAPDQTAEAVTERPTEPAHQSEQQAQPEDPIAAYRQQAQAEVQALQYLRQSSQAEVVLGARIQELVQQHQGEFPGVKNWDDVQRLSPEQKSRWAQYAQAMETLQGQQQQAASQRQLIEHQISSAAEASQARELAAWKSHQDAIVERDVPALRDPVKRVEMTRAAQEVLKEFLGIDEQSVRTLTPEARRLLHYSGTQKLIAELAELRLARKRAAEAVPEHLPQVQRPGVARDRGDRASADLSHLDQRIDRARPGSDKQLRAAASLIAQRRANRGR